MKLRHKRRGCSSVFLHRLVVPIIVGLLVGFVVVVAVLRIGQHVVGAEALPTPMAAPETASPARVVVLLLDRAEEGVIGVWQWWSDPSDHTGKAACVLSPETRIAPSGRTVGEMMRLAMAAGDDAWVARNTQDFAGDCLLGDIGTVAQVILVPRLGMIELVDALGGVRVENRELNGLQVWDYLLSPDISAEQQRRQHAVWIALHAAANRSEGRACDRIANASELIRSVPDLTQPCQELAELLRQTPAFIKTP